MQEGYAVIFVNGELSNPVRLTSIVEEADLCVAADGGYYHARSMGIRPAAVIGDLDSIHSEDIVHLKELGVPIEKSPVDKDETDLELALAWVAERGYRKIYLIAAIGDRLDQTLGNVFLMSHPEYHDFQIWINDGRCEAFLIRDNAEITGEAGERVSLLPLSETVEGVSTKNLAFALTDETLYRWLTRGISNRMESESASVSIRSGLLLCLHEFDGK